MLKLEKNLFLIFPPGTGGNHLANMISIKRSFSPRFTDIPEKSKAAVPNITSVNSHEEYVDAMLKSYQFHFDKTSAPNEMRSLAHFCDLQNLQLETLTTFTDKILNNAKTYIFCAHAVEYAIRKYEKRIEDFNNNIYCVFSLPTEKNLLALNRMKNGPWYQEKILSEYYTKEGFSNIVPTFFWDLIPEEQKDSYRINKDTIFEMDTDLFYTTSGYEYIEQNLKENLGIRLPKCCKIMHTLYIEHQLAVSKYKG
jgi:hypothetical protein